jgi:hypothetical protein
MTEYILKTVGNIAKTRKKAKATNSEPWELRLFEKCDGLLEKAIPTIMAIAVLYMVAQIIRFVFRVTWEMFILNMDKKFFF